MSLLKSGIDPNHKNGFFLDYFISIGDLDMASKLLDHGASTTLTKKNYRAIIPQKKEFSPKDLFKGELKQNSQKIELYAKFAELKELRKFVNFLYQHEKNDFIIDILQMRLQETWNEVERKELESTIRWANTLKHREDSLWVIPKSYGWGIEC
ncbi:MAG: hypothetical protein SNF33_01810 [Candidatus Algichlamydia australiensis]|nr:hypothetical protein [Chlamydiales bacterium]